MRRSYKGGEGRVGWGKNYCEVDSKRCGESG